MLNQKQRITFLIFIFLFQCVLLNAQNAASYNLSSPYNTIRLHLQNLQEDNYRPEVAAKAFRLSGVSTKKSEEYAVKLMQIYKAAGIIITLKDLPKESNYLDSIAEKHIYIINHKYPEIYLERYGARWMYSNETLEHIDGIHKELYPLGSDKLLKILPKMGGKKYFGLQIWQYVGILIIILLSLITHKLFTFVIERIIMSFLIRQGRKQVAKDYIAPVARPLSILILFPILLILVPVLQLPLKLNSYILIALKAIWPVFATIVFYKLADILGEYLTKMAEKTESTLDDQLVPLIKKALKIFVVIIGALAILSNLNVDIIPLLAGLSIGGLAFALAAQDTIKNFFGSIMIFIDKPFQIGDWITSGNIDGTVEEVGFRATRIRTFRNSVTYVPNGMIADSTVDNHGLRVYRRFYTHIAITYDTPPDLINVFVDGLRQIVEKHPHTRKDYYNIYLNDMADFSLNIMFYIFFDVPGWPQELKARHEILIEVIRLAEELGINFAFPTQTLHMETFPEKKGNSPVYEKSSPGMRKRLESFLKKDKIWEEPKQ